MALIENTVAEFGSIAMLINNAGTIRRGQEYPAEYWDEVFAVNRTAVLRLSQLAGRRMLKRGKHGKIINIASMLSYLGGILVPMPPVKGESRNSEKHSQMNGLPKGSMCMRLRQVIGPQTTQPLSIGSPPADGVSRGKWHGPPFFSVPPRATTFMVMF